MFAERNFNWFDVVDDTIEYVNLDESNYDEVMALAKQNVAIPVEEIIEKYLDTKVAPKSFEPLTLREAIKDLRGIEL